MPRRSSPAAGTGSRGSARRPARRRRSRARGSPRRSPAASASGPRTASAARRPGTSWGSPRAARSPPSSRTIGCAPEVRCRSEAPSAIIARSAASRSMSPSWLTWARPDPSTRALVLAAARTASAATGAAARSDGRGTGGTRRAQVASGRSLRSRLAGLSAARRRRRRTRSRPAAGRPESWSIVTRRRCPTARRHGGRRRACRRLRHIRTGNPGATRAREWCSRADLSVGCAVVALGSSIDRRTVTA